MHLLRSELKDKTQVSIFAMERWFFVVVDVRRFHILDISLNLITKRSFKFILDDTKHGLDNLDPPHLLLVPVHLQEREKIVSVRNRVWFTV